MNQVYYRIVRDFVGYQTTFVPEHAYEQVRFNNGTYQECSDTKIKEVCFAKNVEGCLFGINMFLEEGEYHIYETTENPSIDLSLSGIGDFPAIQEVRYRQPVQASYFGTIDVRDFLIHCLRGLYEEANKGKKFNHVYASKELLRFQSVNIEIQKLKMLA